MWAQLLSCQLLASACTLHPCFLLSALRLATCDTWLSRYQKRRTYALIRMPFFPP